MCKYLNNVDFDLLRSDASYATSFFRLTKCKNCQVKECNYRGEVERIGLAAIVLFDDHSFDELLERAEDLDEIEKEYNSVEFLFDDMSTEIDVPEDNLEVLIENDTFNEMCRTYQINKYEYRSLDEFILEHIIDEICYKHINSMICKLNESGSYSHNSKLIKIDIDVFDKAFLNKESFVYLIKVILHESRHSWQYANNWNFNEYVTPDPNMDYWSYMNAFQAYKGNKAEIDANEYAEKAIKNIDLNELCKNIIYVIKDYLSMM